MTRGEYEVTAFFTFGRIQAWGDCWAGEDNRLELEMSLSPNKKKWSPVNLPDHKEKSLNILNMIFTLDDGYH